MKALPDSSGKLKSWLEGQLNKLDEKTSIRLTLRQVAGKVSVVDRWTAMKSSDPAELAAEVLRATQTDAHYLGGGSKRYELVGVVDGEQVGRHGWRVEEETGADDDDGATGRYRVDEAVVGLLKQSQTHVEGLVRALVTLVVGTDKSRLAEIERLGSRNASIEDKLEKMRELIVASQDKQFERDLRRSQFDNNERRLDEAFATGRTLLPFALNAIAKKQLLPTGDNSLLKEALKPAFKNLTTDQLEKLQAILTPSQVVAILEVWKLLEEEDKKPNGQSKNPQST